MKRWPRRAVLSTWGLAGLTMSVIAACGSPAPSQPAPPRTSAPAQSQASQQAAPRDSGSLRFSIWTGDPPTLDPYLIGSFRSQELAAFFYSRLLMSKKGPGLAAQAYIMEGSFERFMKVSPQRGMFEYVADVAAADARTVQFRLKDAHVPFEADVGAPFFWILPREVVEQDGDASRRIVGSGPFVFDKFEPGVALTGKKNPTYYRAGEPHVDEFVALTIPDDATAMAGLRSHDLDFYQVAEQNVDALKKSNPELQYVEWEYLLIPFVYWKLDKPPFSDVRVRQAVAMALNRDGLIQTVFNGRGNWNNAIPWALRDWWLDPRGPDMGPNAKYFTYDPAEARQLLAAAGYPDGLKIDLISTPGYGQVWVQMVELMQQDLKSAGIDATLLAAGFCDHGSAALGDDELAAR